MAASIHRFAETVTCFAFNGDGSKLALCPNNNTIHIYSKNGKDWNKDVVLEEHTQLVTALDWAPKSNRIVSCSQDRNAYVWTFEAGKYTPTLVILRLNRAATHCAWSPLEDKFAVASGAKLVSVCYFEEDNDWWVSKHVKKHRSTVLSVKWHPNNVLIATASSDYKARVFSAWTKGIDKRGAPCPVPEAGKKAERFGEMLCEFDSPGWVKDVDWSPSGNLVAYVSQDSSLRVADVTTGEVSILKLTRLPLARVLFVSENQLVGAGYDNEPYLFTSGAGGWTLSKELDPKKQVAAKATGALGMWKNMDSKGTKTATKKLETKHQNAITCMATYPGGQVVTSGLDGNLIFWKL